MALTEQTISIGVYDVTCDETWCTARLQGVHGLTEGSTRQVAVTDGWTCDVSGDWCPIHAPVQVDGTQAFIARGIVAGLVPPITSMEEIPLLQRGYSRPLGESEQTSTDALESAIAAFHAGVDVQLNQRRGYIEEMAAAYFSHTMIAPEDAVLVEQHDGMTTRWWFEPRGGRS